MTTKTLFLVRHGESAWNLAVAGLDVAGMYSGVDHPLSQQGAEQGLLFRERWRHAAAATEGEGMVGEAGAPPASAAAAAREATYVQEFARAQRVFSSPLTRALQTALLSLQGHQAVARHGITLLRAAREVKNAAGRDTVGCNTGHACKERALSLLAQLQLGRDARAFDACVDP